MKHAVDGMGQLVTVMTGQEVDALRRQMKHWDASEYTDTPAGQLYEIVNSDLPLSYRDGGFRADFSVITPQIAAHVLSHFGQGGYPAGDFTRGLIGIICRADPENFALLSLGFPGYVLAAHLAQNIEGGIDILRGLQ